MGLEKFVDGKIASVKNGYIPGRLTLVSSVAVPETDVATSSNIYFTPASGNVATIYNGTEFASYQFSELTLNLTAGVNLIDVNYDVYLYYNGSNLALGTSPAWSTISARGIGAATNEFEIFQGYPVNRYPMALYNNGVLTNIIARQGTLVGSFRTHVAGETRDTSQYRFISNVYNPTIRPLMKMLTGGSWNYTSDGWQVSGGGSSTNAVSYIQTMGGRFVSMDVLGTASGSNVAAYPYMGIGLNTNMTDSSQQRTRNTFASTSFIVSPMARYKGYTSLGLNAIYGLERVAAPAGTVTWYATDATYQSGLLGEILI